MRLAVITMALFCYLNIALAAPSDDFVTTWKTDNSGTSSDTSITVPMVGGPYDVDWDNDGDFDDTGINDSIAHDFGVAGNYTIRIRGIYDSIQFNNDGDKNKILSIDQWGTQSWTSMERAFRGATYLTMPAIDTPDFSAVTDMSYMFANTSSANPNTSGWNTAAVTDMRLMFYKATSANPDTSAWDTGAVLNMDSMFVDATSANPDTSGWNTEAVTNMSSMFYGATSANPDTSGWDTTEVIYMGWMFRNATSANPDTSGWDTAAVTSMRWMFAFASSANPDTSGWDTSAVTSMHRMFNGAASANPNTSGWDTSAVTDMSFMFHGATSAQPDTSGWDTSLVTNMQGMFTYAYSANPNTSGWNTAAVTSMGTMFYNATSANPDTSGWNTSKVGSMSSMFEGATSANPDTSGWNTSKVTSMFSMFEGATSANPNVSGWNTSLVHSMSNMFKDVTSFDQDIGSWDVTRLSKAFDMFAGVKLSTANYDSLLVHWEAQSLRTYVNFSAGNSTYCSDAASTARANMIASDSWAITDGGQVCPTQETCNANIVSGVTEYFDASYEACEILIVAPSFIVADGASVSFSSGWEIGLLPGFSVEEGAIFSASVCSQSLCMTSDYPMPYGCHSCVNQICDIDPTCCKLEFDQACLDQVDTVCNLVCE